MIFAIAVIIDTKITINFYKTSYKKQKRLNLNYTLEDKIFKLIEQQ